MSKPTAHSKSYLLIGQIAERSGVSAKALRLYEQRGLLKPCAYSDAGYRLYGPDALRSLMQIVMLKRSGFSLVQIAALLSSQAPVTAGLLDQRIRALQRELNEKAVALTTLQTVAKRMEVASTLDLNQLLESITMTHQLDIHATEKQREEIFARAEKFKTVHTPEEFESMKQRVSQHIDNLGAAGLEDAQRPWRELSAEIRAAMAAGKPANDPAVIALAHRWQKHVASLTALDPNLIATLRDTYTKHPELMVEQSMSPAMMDYMSEAMAVGVIKP